MTNAHTPGMEELALPPLIPVDQLPPCPSWCATDHQAVLDDLMRECAAASRPIRTLAHRTVSAECVRFVDRIDGEVRPAEVRVGDDTLSPTTARLYAAEILAAATTAQTWNARSGA